MKDRVAIPFTSPNPTYRFIREIYETTKLEEVAELLTTNLWIAIAAAPSKDGTYLFSLARVG